jgi:hypothetical protein
MKLQKETISKLGEPLTRTIKQATDSSLIERLAFTRFNYEALMNPFTLNMLPCKGRPMFFVMCTPPSQRFDLARIGRLSCVSLVTLYSAPGSPHSRVTAIPGTALISTTALEFDIHQLLLDAWHIACCRFALDILNPFAPAQPILDKVGIAHEPADRFAFGS